jgi:hypothetical protein
MFDDHLLHMFWNLVQNDFKSQVYKIINDTSFYLKQNHIDFLFDQILKLPEDQLQMDEFNCLKELGRQAKDSSF